MVRMDSENQGSIVAGIISAIVLMFFLGLYYLPFAILAGVIAGLASRRAGKGTAGALIGAVIISLLMVLLSRYELSHTTNFLNRYLGSGTFSTELVSLLSSYTGVTLLHSIVMVFANQIIPATAGGFVGGALIGKKYSVEEEEQEVPKAAPARPTPAKTEPNTSDIDKQLQRLKKMHESGTITDEEYDSLKKRFVG